MLKLLITIIILIFPQFALADSSTCYSSCITPQSDLVADPSLSANCGVDNDDDCTTGYCGYFSENSPINIPNMFGVLINDWLDFGTPSIFLNMLETVSVGTCGTEGAYVTLKCPGVADANGNYDWMDCPATYETIGSYNTNYACASPNLAKPAVTSNGSFITGARGQQQYCPLMRANIPTPDLWFNLYYYVFITGETTSNYRPSVSTGKFGPGLCQIGAVWLCPLDIIELQVVQEGDQICMQGLFPGYSLIFRDWLTISCKYSPPPLPYCASNTSPQVSCAGGPCDNTQIVTCTTACFVASSCVGNVPSSMHTLSRFTFLGNFIECFTDTLNSLFVNPPPGCPQTALLYYFQIQMRQVVAAILTLYVIFMGIKIAASGEMPKKSEFFMFIIKFALVLYFAVGSFTSDAGSSNIYNNGLQFVYQSAFAFMNEFANNIMKAAGAAENGFCLFPPNSAQYADGYSYLALWDSLDCHISAYLGIYDLQQGYSKITTLLSAIFIYMLGFNPVMSLFLLAFVFFMISVMIYVTNIFALCMLGMAFVIYLGPIFIPLSLFTFTKQYFDSWFKLLLSYVLQPAVVIAGLALIIVTLDNQMYNGCTFQMEGPSASGYYYAIFNQTPGPNWSTCQGSLGYFVSMFQQSDLGSLLHIDFYTFYSPSLPSFGFMSSLMTIALLLFIFQEFVTKLGALAADITGGMDMSGGAMASPKDMQAVMSNLFKATKAIGRRALMAGIGEKNRGGGVPPAPPAGGGRGGGGGGSGPGPGPGPGGTAATRLSAALDAGVNPMFKKSAVPDAGAANNPFNTPPPVRGGSVTAASSVGAGSPSSLGFSADLRSSALASKAGGAALPNTASAVAAATSTVVAPVTKADVLNKHVQAAQAFAPKTNPLAAKPKRGTRSAGSSTVSTSPEAAAVATAPSAGASVTATRPAEASPRVRPKAESAIDRLHKVATQEAPTTRARSKSVGPINE